MSRRPRGLRVPWAATGLAALLACAGGSSAPPIPLPEPPPDSQPPTAPAPSGDAGAQGDATSPDPEAGSPPAPQAGESPSGDEPSAAQEAALPAPEAGAASSPEPQAGPEASGRPGGAGAGSPAPGDSAARVGEIEDRIQEVMGAVDGILRESRRDQGRDAQGPEGEFPTPGGLPGGRAGSSGGEESVAAGDGSESGGGAAGGGSAAGGSETTPASGYPGRETSAGESGATVQVPGGSGPVPAGDSDIFRRQICEAARTEPDPELREALEAECRKYGGGVK
jgi:hypothetical protein